MHRRPVRPEPVEPVDDPYVISNLGSFGPNVAKIGMTRRLHPETASGELGDASVPFTYDIHALFFCDDAVTLENQFHHELGNGWVNWINNRRECFFATPDEVRQVLTARVGVSSNTTTPQNRPNSSESELLACSHA